MAVDTSAVQISINVVDNSTGQIEKVSQSLTSLGSAGATSGQRVSQSFTSMGNAGATSGRMVSQSMDAVSKSMLSAVEQTRLTTEVVGVRLPRAMITLISQSKAAQAALGAIGNAMIGLATIQIGAMIFDAATRGAEKFYTKFLDVDGAMKRFNDEAGEASSKKFYEDSGLDQLNADLKLANQQMDQLYQKKAISQDMSVGWKQFGDELNSSLNSIATLGMMPYKYHFSVADQNAMNDSSGKRDAGQLRTVDKTHEKNIQQIEDADLLAQAKVAGIAKASAARDAEYKKADEDERYANDRAQAQAAIANRGIDNTHWYGNARPGDKGYRAPVVVSPDTGKAENADAKAHADAEFQAKLIEINQQNKKTGEGKSGATDARALASEIQRIHEQADEATLKGIALIEYQRKAADAAFVHAHGANAQVLADIDRKYYAEEKTLLAKQAEDVRTMFAASVEGGAKVLHEADEFKQRVDQMGEQDALRGTQGFARIQAQMRMDLARFDKEAAGSLNANPADVARGEAGIRAGAADQTAERAASNREETAALEDEARAKMLASEKDQTAAIGEEYRQRTEKFNEELVTNEISQDDYNRRMVAAAQIEQAQLADSARQAREKMAGEFTGLFKGMDHPLQYLKEEGDKVAGQAAAAMVQRVQNHYGGAGASATPLTLDSLMDKGFARIAGGHKGAGAPGAPSASGAAPGVTPTGSGVKAISLATAEIHIQSANIGFGGTGVSGGNRPAYSGSGGTTLTAPGAMGASGGLADSGSGSGSYGAPGSAGATGNAGATGAAGNAGASSTGGSGSVASAASGLAGTVKSTALSSGAPWSRSGSTGAGVAPVGGSGDAGHTVNDAVSQGAGIVGKTGSALPPRNTVGAALGDVSQGIGLGTQAMSIFGGGGKSGGASGSGNAGATSSSGSGTAASGAGGTVGAAKSAASSSGSAVVDRVASGAQGAIGLYSAYQGNGGVGGALSGAASGMQLGMAVGGPLGAAIGAAAGAALGAIAPGGREHARAYDLKQVHPRIYADTQSYEQGSMDYMTAYSDMEALEMEAQRTTSKMGPVAVSYYNDTIVKELKQAEAKFTAMEKSGRRQFTSTAAQYATGTDYVPGTGMAVLHQGERIIPTDQNQQITRALTSNDGDKMNASPAQGGDVHIHVHAIDTKSGAQWLMGNKHILRSAVNASYAENSGGADAGY